MHDPDGPRRVQGTGTAAIIFALMLLQASDVVRDASPRAARALLIGACLYIAITMALAVFSAVAWSRESRER